MLLVALALTGTGCSAGGGGSTADAGGVADVPADTGKADRSVVITGDMSILVADVPDAGKRAAAVVDAAGGRIDGRDERSYGADSGDAITTLTLRIPASKLDEALDSLRELGEVESVTTTTADVTDAVQDVGARISALESTLQRLDSFQQQATSVDDLLTIQKEIESRQAELEDLEGQRDALAEQTAYSTITLTIRSAGSPRALPTTFWDGIVTGWTALTSFTSLLAVLVGVLLPWLLVLLVIAAAIVVLVRVARRRRARRTALPSSSSNVFPPPQFEPMPAQRVPAATDGVVSADEIPPR